MDGYRLLLVSALAGVSLIIIAYLLIGTFRTIGLWSPVVAHTYALINSLWHERFRDQNSGACSLAFGLGVVLPHILNLTENNTRRIGKSIEMMGDPLEKLLYKALNTGKPIMLSLKSNKVYMGFVTESSSTAVPVESMVILPWASGSRDPTKRVVNFTTDYSPVYQKILAKDKAVHNLDINDFQFVIPFREIESAHIFDVDVYTHFFGRYFLADPSAHPLSPRTDAHK